MLCSWMSNSLDALVLATASQITNAKLMWDLLKARYFIENGLCMHQLWSNKAVIK